MAEGPGFTVKPSLIPQDDDRLLRNAGRCRARGKRKGKKGARREAILAMTAFLISCPRLLRRSRGSVAERRKKKKKEKRREEKRGREGGGKACYAMAPGGFATIYNNHPCGTAFYAGQRTSGKKKRKRKGGKGRGSSTRSPNAYCFVRLAGRFHPAPAAGVPAPFPVSTVITAIARRRKKKGRGERKGKKSWANLAPVRHDHVVFISIHHLFKRNAPPSR